MAELKRLGMSIVQTGDSESTVVKRPVKSKPVLAKIKVHKASETKGRYIKILTYGHSSSGKTLAIEGFLLQGEVVLVVSTDVGGEGLTSVRTSLKAKKREDLLNNLYYVELPNYTDVETFLKTPEVIWPEVYDAGITMAAWDGFSGFQQIQLSDYVSEMKPVRGAGGKEISDAREAGLFLEQVDWGTVRNLARFLAMHNRKDGTLWHKYVTCLESGKLLQDTLSGETQRAPLIQGSAAALVGPALDVILRMSAKRKRGANVEDEGGPVEYKYLTTGHDKMLAKSRGLILDPEEPADMSKLWAKIKSQLGINSPEKDESVIGVVENVENDD
jgi:hypothetical protein